VLLKRLAIAPLLALLWQSAANATGSAIEVRPTRFDLLCTGQSLIDGTTKKSFSTRLRIDLAKKLFCTDDCRLDSISRITPSSIEYHLDSDTPPDSSSRDVGQSGYLAHERDDWVISFPELKYRDLYRSLGGDIVAYWYEEARQGICSMEPFSGFNGQLLYPKQRPASGVPYASATPDVSDFREAFAKNVVLRMISASKFVPSYAVWLSRQRNSYLISATRNGRCDRLIDGRIARRLIHSWEDALRMTDTIEVPYNGNKTVFRFSMRSDFSSVEGWAKDSEGPAYSRPSALISIGEALAAYCQSGDKGGLNEELAWLDRTPR